MCDGAGGCTEPAPETCPSGLLCDGAGAACRGACAGSVGCAAGFYCAGGSCLPSQTLGGACASARDCESGWCVDGVCCEEACGGACRSCALDGREGACVFATRGQDPRGSCGDGRVCDGSGACSARGGESCGAGTECLSGHCSDGYCCDAACDGACEACDLPGAVGSCTAVPEGEDPDGECPGASLCGPRGGCASADGAACSGDGECLSGRCSDGACCGADCGPCHGCAEPGSEGSCAPRRAATDPEEDCAGASLCDGKGGCTLPAGERCMTDLQCMSGHCADGLCCASACAERCRSCALPGSEGVCTPIGHGADPDGECTGNAACDGAGACARPLGEACAAGAECLSGACADGVCCRDGCEGSCRRCDLPGGRGLCLSVPRGSDPSGDCGEGAVCDGSGGCLGVAGGACALAADCLGGYCEDGLCCDRPCGGLCEACDLPGTEGRCSPVAPGSDPAGDCAGAGVCGPFGICVAEQGGPCATDFDCLGGVCADGVCCDSLCPGPCEACDLDGSAGTCSPMQAGAAPRHTCPEPLVCDGAGRCGTPAGARCRDDGDCALGACTDGVCCEEECDEPCRSCAVEGSEGRCALVPPGSDPDSDCEGSEVCGASGSCVRREGMPCEEAGDCLSAFCTDGVCCEEACGGTCRACDRPGLEGACAPLPAGTDPGGDCEAGALCDGAGACAAPGGEPCTEDASCLDGGCADGVCCDSVCDGLCEACDLDGRVGTCAPVPAGSDPDAECPASRACDGKGGCAWELGAFCANGGDCVSGHCADGVCCEEACAAVCHGCAELGSAGSCVPLATGSDPENECLGLDTCDGAGGCALMTGAGCTEDGECVGGFCTDRSCCDERCGGLCESCALSGLEGTCALVPWGQDPDGECGAVAACNGVGSCDLEDGQPCSVGVDCLSGHCADGVCCAEACDGLCVRCDLEGAEGDCGPAPAGQDSADECEGVLVCDGSGGCLVPRGESCERAGDCLSGMCVDGVCCDSACDAPCSACDLQGSEGSCAPVAAGQDPKSDCPIGACDGAGACARGLGEPCAGDAGCLSGRCVEGICCSSVCEAACMGCSVVGSEGTCAPLAHGAGAGGDCPEGQACDGAGGCAQKLGGACGFAEQCLSGWCVDGVCCDEECDGACESCGSERALGRCTPVAAGSDPAGECAGAGVCDGEGGCASPLGASCGGGEECLSGHCADGACCDSACDGLCESCGGGSCVLLPPGTDPEGECAGTAVCDGGGRCAALNGAECGSVEECLSGHCAAGVCCDAACEGPCEVCDRPGAAGRCAHVPRGGDPSERCPGSQVCDGAGACVRPLGESCERGGDCLSGACADGLCCDAPCGGLCEACDLFGSEGRCAPLQRGWDPADECPGEQSCDGASGCARPVGEACGADDDCLSGFCTDGVCCSGGCGEACLACDRPGVVGLCRPEAAGSDPEDDCPGAGTCDGSGECVLPLGEPCRGHVECASRLCVDLVCCEERCDGACVACNTPGARGTCAPVGAGLDPGDQCEGAAVCDGRGGCGAPAGQSCEAGSECLSGACADGVCCDQACDRACHACNVTGYVGRCVLVPRGEDPRNECVGTAACDGIGSCAHQAGAPCEQDAGCLSAFCADGVCCDGPCERSCEACDLPGLAGSCLPVPAGTDPSRECAAGGTCDGAGRCVLPEGSACGASGECASGWCVDGVCCASASCPGPCRSCAVAGLEGDCALVPRGLDPSQACPGDELCDGEGSCVRLDGAPCGSGASCLSGHCRDGLCCAEACDGPCRRCDGAVPGECVAVTSGEDPDTCRGGLACDGGGVCRSALGRGCGSDGGCVTGVCSDGVCCTERCDGVCLRCDGGEPGRCVEVAGVEDRDTCASDSTCDAKGECKPKSGQPCVSGAECSSGFCIDGLCCDGACDGACEACDLAGAEGSCSAVPAGSDPDAECASGERCDGAGACLLVDGAACRASAECLGGSCVDEVCCADAECPGTCRSCAVPGVEGRCAFFTRGSDPEAECEGAAACDGSGGCAANEGSTCAEGADCLSGACADGLCCDAACDGPCESCAVFGFEGSCKRYAAGTDPEGECGDAALCDGAGACLKLVGEPCSGPGDCLSAHCVDGFCCDTSCSQPCAACDLWTSFGRCSPVPAADDPGGDCPRHQVCDGAGGCVKLEGEACGSGAECLRGRCVDGLCCDAACGDLCHACDVEGAEGVCAPVPYGQDVDGECGEGGACNGAGRCVGPAGSPCAADGDCESRWCVDGVCCESACEGLCKRCDASGESGRCVHVQAGLDTSDDCPGAEVCDGAGACKKLEGQACGSGDQCLSGFCSDLRCCDAACEEPCLSCDQAGAEGRCTPVPAQTDPADEECPGPAVCDAAGRCALPGAGSCKADADCLSGFCADGVCCDTACNGPCEACDLAGRLGTCTPTEDGSDPEDECPPCWVCDGGAQCRHAVDGPAPPGDCVSDPAQPCATDGTCDGLGACRARAQGVVCEAQSCAEALQSNADLCDGAGSCADGGVLGCDPYTCNGDTCRSSCSAHTHCLDTHFCSGSLCASKLDEGTSCTEGAQCKSGFCADGLCCEAVCDGLCERCDNPGLEGSCRLVVESFANADPDGECGEVCRVCGEETGEGACVLAQDGSDPDDDCAAEPKSTCGRDGACGGGVCRSWAEGTQCIAEVCIGSSLHEERFCDAGSICAPGGASACTAGFMCNESQTACRSSCTKDAHCQELFWCDTGTNRCVPQLEVGKPCSADSHCLAAGDGAGRCVDGVCCESACDGLCEACNLSGGKGSCLPLAANTDPARECKGLCESCNGARGCGPTRNGTDPEKECSSQAQSTCGRDGQCDGSGGCRRWAAGTVCREKTCKDGMWHHADTCNGRGTCTDGGTTSCGSDCPASCMKSCATQPTNPSNGRYASCKPTAHGAECTLSCNSGYYKTGDAVCDQGSWRYPRSPACFRAMVDYDWTLVDPATGLRWRKTPLGIDNGPYMGGMQWYFNWHYAKSYCEGIGPDWRLPRIEELRSLLRGCAGVAYPGGRCGVTSTCTSYPPLNECWDRDCNGCWESAPTSLDCLWDPQLEGPCNIYWSSTPNPGARVESRWTLRFYSGVVAARDSREGIMTPSAAAVRCVRPY